MNPISVLPRRGLCAVESTPYLCEAVFHIVSDLSLSEEHLKSSYQLPSR